MNAARLVTLYTILNTTQRDGEHTPLTLDLVTGSVSLWEYLCFKFLEKKKKMEAVVLYWAVRDSGMM